jgi:hypothetical protein
MAIAPSRSAGTQDTTWLMETLCIGHFLVQTEDRTALDELTAEGRRPYRMAHIEVSLGCKEGWPSGLRQRS